MRKGGGGELKTAVLSPPSRSLSKNTVSRDGGFAANLTPLPGDVRTQHGLLSPSSRVGESATVHESGTLPRVLSCINFPDDTSRMPSWAAEKEPGRASGSASAGDSAKKGASRLWPRFREWIRRFLRKKPGEFQGKGDALSESLRVRRGGFVAAASLSHFIFGFNLGPTASNAAVGRTARVRVPGWVRAPFALTAALPAGAVTRGVRPTQSMRCLRPSVAVFSVPQSEPGTACEKLEARETISPDAVAVVQPLPPLRTDVTSDKTDAAGGTVRQGDSDVDEALVSSHLTQELYRYRCSLSPVEVSVTSTPPGAQLPSATLTFNTSNVSLCDGEDAPEADKRRPRLELPPRKTMIMPAAARSESAGGTARLPAAASLITSHLAEGQNTQEKVPVRKTWGNGHRPLPLARHDGGRSSAIRGISGSFTDARNTGLSFSWNSSWHGGGTQSLPVSPATTFWPQAATSAATCRGSHVYTAELVGWLQLLVWVRWQVIHFLRDLSGVQGFVAWSAWYWSWAQDHPRQAAFHQALSSAAFWRGLWSRGFRMQLNQVQYNTSRHMFTLRSVFQLIVSYIGAVYTALDTLNMLVIQVQRSCEVMMSTAAAAAAVAARSSPTVLTGSILTRSPSQATLANARRDGGGRGHVLHSNQNGIFWNSVMAGRCCGDGSSLIYGHSDRVGSSQGLPQSTPGSDTAAVTTSARHDVHDEAEGESGGTVVGDEVETVSSLHALDELRCAVWSTLHKLKAIFCLDGLPPDLLEVNDQACFSFSGVCGDNRGRGPSRAGPATATTAGPDTRAGLHQPGDSSFSGVSAPQAAPTAQPSVSHTHFAEDGQPGARDDGDPSESRQANVREGAQVLLQCVQQSQQLLRRLTVLVQRSHSPPAARHWRRIFVASVTLVPPLIWLYTKSPAELTAITQQTVMVGRRILRSYVIDPVAQLRESLFYVRPGVEDRRGAVERDAVSLANIIRDFHEDMYPNMPQKRLEELRVRTFKRLRAGVADPEGLGLIDEQYRQSVRHPIRSILFGDLPRIMLIQLSYQALEVSRVANGIDEVLEGNDINFKIMAMMPVFLAVGLLATWGLFRRRSKYKPVRLRMKLLWRSLYRVVSFAGSDQGLVLPPLRITTQHQGRRERIEATTPVVDYTHAHWLRRKGVQRHMCSHADATGPTLVSPWPPRKAEWVGSGGRDDANVTASGGRKSASDSSSDEALSAIGVVASVQQLNNYEQGMVLLLSHVMRSIAVEHLRSYALFHEFMEDLNDLESVQSTRQQRLSTLKRMRVTHTHFF
ncbi:hypothetical protein JKF63_02265 [Porcisia hertigi]|uniref:Uncharacterized protein n=1 Tax=Porcisia hertigi TaxID=2761500 RepID=A0A836I2C3_9TRYP|nr:hypothetical protein JKF63_02265 [Porcisia hertigi]